MGVGWRAWRVIAEFLHRPAEGTRVKSRIANQLSFEFFKLDGRTHERGGRVKEELSEGDVSSNCGLFFRGPGYRSLSIPARSGTWLKALHGIENPGHGGRLHPEQILTAAKGFRALPRDRVRRQGGDYPGDFGWHIIPRLGPP